MAIKYVSGKTRELKVGLSSYSEGKPSLQVTGNVGVGTTNPLSSANSANTSVVSSGIVTSYNIYSDQYYGDSAGNFIAGPSAGSSLTTGSENILLGTCVGAALTTGQKNVFLGDEAGKQVVGNCNILIGNKAGCEIQTSGCSNNIGIGCNVFSGETGGYNNIAIGGQAGRSFSAYTAGNSLMISIGLFAGRSGLTTSIGNISIGCRAGDSLISNTTCNNHNIMIGDNAGYSSNGDDINTNILIGCRSGYFLANGPLNSVSENVILGTCAGMFSSGACNIYIGTRAVSGSFGHMVGDNNVAIGQSIQLPKKSGSSQLAIGQQISGVYKYWIAGDSNYDVGIGITNPSVANVGAGDTQKLAAGIVTAYSIFTNQLNLTGVTTTTGNVDINADLDVDGHTELDNLNVSGVSTFNDNVHLLDNDKLLFGGSAGTHDGLEIYHDSNHNYIKDTGTGHLYFQGSQIWIADVSGTTPSATFSPTSDTKLYYSGSEKIRTTGYGISVAGGVNATGVSTFNDDVEFIGNAAGITSAFWDKSANELKFYDGSKITLGDGQDLELSHNGTDSLIRDSRASGSVLRIGADKLWLQNKDGNEPYLEATDNGSVKLYHDFLPRFETTGIGITIAGIGSTAYIEGPSNIIIDPHPYGIGTTSGNVFIKGDLYVEGTEFIVDVDKIELGDFQIGIATTAGTNALLDGAGIGIGSTNIRKFITWNNATNALMTSENWNLASGKHYEINGTDVLTSDTLLVGTGASVHSPSNNILTLHTNGAEKLRIDASGNLGIGTAVPTDSANAANTSVTSAGIVTALEYYGIFKGSIPGFSTVFSSSSGSFSATPGTPQTIDTFAFSTHDYQIAEYTLHFVHANGIQAQKALVMQDNSVAYSNEYGVMYDSELLVSIAATVSSGNVNITATPEAGISGVTTFRWRREVQT